MSTKATEKRQFGITGPLSKSMPTKEDLALTKQLHAELEQHNSFESPEQLNHRMEVLAQLDVLLKNWVKKTGLSKRVPALAANNLGGKIYTFGSFRLGVHDQGADIDALCVAPLCITSVDFFRNFYRELKEHPKVTECRSIEEAFVPVIKMKFDGIEIDLLFARLALREIPDNLKLDDDMLLRNLDEYTVRSLNGCRVTDAILHSVPDKETFCLALRAIKLWAKKRGIYSNSLGYFGGVTWAMLMARICQLYPNAASAILIQKFFLVISGWNWPNPILLQKIDFVDLGHPVWNPRVNLNDRFHLMPIITPAYPQQNSTYNVTESTKSIIVAELKAAKILTNDIVLGQATWSNLFETPSFFHKYKHFIVVLATATSEEDQMAWCGFMESKLRLLVGTLEKDQNISLAHINPKKFAYKPPTERDCPLGNSVPHTTLWFIGLTFNTYSLNLDLTVPIRVFVSNLMTQAMKIELLKSGMDVDVRYTKHNQLSLYLNKEILQNDLMNKKRALARGEKSNSMEKPNTVIEKPKKTIDEKPNKTIDEKPNKNIVEEPDKNKRRRCSLSSDDDNTENQSSKANKEKQIKIEKLEPGRYKLSCA